MDILKKSGIIQKKFSGKQYQLKLLPARQGLVLANKLIKLLGTSFGVSIDSGLLEGEIKDYSFATNVAIALTSAMDKVDIVDLIEEVLLDLEVNGVKIDFDEHFRGNYGELTAVVQWALAENFGDFITGFLKAKGIDFSEILTKMKNPQMDKEEKPEELKN